jgi:hypothetical protein
MTQPAPCADAVSILVDAADAISHRAAQRDQPDGERSMGRCVQAFNALFGTTLTETQGWQFMALLKIARSTGGALHMDDHTDHAAYAALAGECAARQLALAAQVDRDSAAADASIAHVKDLLARRRANQGKPED